MSKYYGILIMDFRLIKYAFGGVMGIIDLLKKGNVDGTELSEDRQEKVESYFEKLFDLIVDFFFKCI